MMQRYGYLLLLLCLTGSVAGCSAGFDTSTSEPADPPPITLGSYPWIIITEKPVVTSRNTLIFQGLALDTDDPPGIPIKYGVVKRSKKEPRSAGVPIRVKDKLNGFLEFEVPAAWAHEGKMVIELSGPGYTNVDFPVCD